MRILSLNPKYKCQRPGGPARRGHLYVKSGHHKSGGHHLGKSWKHHGVDQKIGNIARRLVYNYIYRLPGVQKRSLCERRIKCNQSRFGNGPHDCDGLRHPGHGPHHGAHHTQHGPDHPPHGPHHGRHHTQHGPDHPPHGPPHHGPHHTQHGPDHPPHGPHHGPHHTQHGPDHPPHGPPHHGAHHTQHGPDHPPHGPHHGPNHTHHGPHHGPHHHSHGPHRRPHHPPHGPHHGPHHPHGLHSMSHHGPSQPTHLGFHPLRRHHSLPPSGTSGSLGLACHLIELLKKPNVIVTDHQCEHHRGIHGHHSMRGHHGHHHKRGHHSRYDKHCCEIGSSRRSKSPSPKPTKTSCICERKSCAENPSKKAVKEHSPSSCPPECYAGSFEPVRCSSPERSPSGREPSISLSTPEESNTPQNQDDECTRT